MKKISLLLWVAIAFLPGIFGPIATSPNIPTWYATLNKPFFTPPNWIFGPVWMLLYLSMGIAAYLVWAKGWTNKAVKVALTIFIIQLILNGLWSILFFGQHLLLIALIEIVVLWLLIILTIIKFYPLSKAAGLILIPYLLWVSFASVLNGAFWLLNK